MFGYAAFAQPAFAALGKSGTLYTVSLFEAITLADINVGSATFNNAISEAITFADSISVAAAFAGAILENLNACLLYTSPSPRDRTRSRMPSSA